MAVNMYSSSSGAEDALDMAPRRRTPRQLLAAQLMRKASDTSEPVFGLGHGFAKLASGALAGYLEGAEERAARDRDGATFDALAAPRPSAPTLGNGTGGSTPSRPSAPSTSAAPVQGIQTGSITPHEDLAIRTTIGEAIGEGPRGWQAVAGVIKNRADQSGMNLSDVVLAKNQFEPWSSRRGELMGYDPNGSRYQQVAGQILPILRGEAADPTNGATHFYAPKAQRALGRSAPSWDDGSGTDIGNHRFFSLGYRGGGPHGIQRRADTGEGAASPDWKTAQGDDAQLAAARGQLAYMDAMGGYTPSADDTGPVGLPAITATAPASTPPAPVVPPIDPGMVAALMGDGSALPSGMPPEATPQVAPTAPTPRPTDVPLPPTRPPGVGGSTTPGWQTNTADPAQDERVATATRMQTAGMGDDASLAAGRAARMEALAPNARGTVPATADAVTSPGGPPPLPPSRPAPAAAAPAATAPAPQRQALAQALSAPPPALPDERAGVLEFATGEGNRRNLAQALAGAPDAPAQATPGQRAIAQAMNGPAQAAAQPAGPVDVRPPVQGGPAQPTAAPAPTSGGGLLGLFGIGQQTSAAPAGMTSQMAALRSAYVNGDSATRAQILRMMNPELKTAVINGRLIDERTGKEIYVAPDRPEYGVIRKDAYGNEEYGWKNPNTQTVTPYRPQGDTGTGVLPGQPGSTIPAPPPGVDPRIWRKEQSEEATRNALPAPATQVAEVRKEVIGLPSYKNLTQAMPIYRSMAETAGRNSRASDLNLVYGLGKIMDPGSVVREGEMVMVKNTASLPDWLVGAANSLNGGQALQPETRKAIMAEAHSRMRSYEDQYEIDVGHYRGIAKRGRMTEDDVVPKFPRMEPWQPAPVPATNPAAAALDGARAAIARGAPREQVIERLRRNGIDPGGL